MPTLYMESALVDLNVIHVMQAFPRKVHQKHVTLHIEDITLHSYTWKRMQLYEVSVANISLMKIKSPTSKLIRMPDCIDRK